jgi:hypothetical protein
VTDVRVEIIPDTTAIGGGRAVLRLIGVYDLPVDATYHIEPADEAINPAADPGWPSGDRKPNGSHLSHDGIELLIGPDVVEARLLAPGTAIILSVPAANVETRLRWPDIPQRTNRSPIKLLPPPTPQPSRTDAAHTEDPTQTATGFAPDQPNPETTPPIDVSADQAEPVHTANDTFGPDLANDLFGDSQQDEAATAEQYCPEPHANDPATFQSEFARQDDGTRPNDGRSDDGAAASQGFETNGYLRDRPYPVRMRPRYVPRPNLVRPFLMGVSLAGLVGLAAWMGFQREITLYVQSVAQSRLAEVGSIAPVAPSAAATLTKIIDAREGSPIGQRVAGVGVTQALARANASLRQEPPDYTKARFWLRKAIGKSLGSKEMTWALTQLGTLHAVDGASPTEYARARMLWELAAAQGDAMATCLLGALNQKGLGGPADAERAKTLYAQAQKLGGCKQAENPAQQPLPAPP